MSFIINYNCNKNIEHNKIVGGKNMKSIEWMCRNCGQKQIKVVSVGRPMPGRCPRSKSGGPHRWVRNRSIGK